MIITLEPITLTIAAEFRAVRLRALLDSPTAFGSTYAKEIQLTDSDWASRAAQWNGDRSVGYLAIADRQPCGIAAGFIDADNAAKAHLVSMWVAPTHRKSGVGTQLVSAAIAWARSKHAATMCPMVTSNNAAAISFYKRLGFVMTGRTEPYPNDPVLLEFEMRYRIQNGIAWPVA